MSERIEMFDAKYKAILNEPSHTERWNSLIKIHKKDPSSFRILFTIEALALADKWREPTCEKLNAMLAHGIGGGRFAITAGQIIDLIQPVWPLELAKVDVSLFRAFSKKYSKKGYPLTNMKLWSTAIVQTWWAFETLMNDFADIILNERKDTLNNVKALFLADQAASLNKKGMIEEKPMFQNLEARVQFIYATLTNETIDRSGRIWQDLMNLKSARDGYIHRIGSAKKGNFKFLDETVLFRGLKAVQEIIFQVFTKTPEFLGKFVYTFLSFWSCQVDQPFVWDSKEGRTLNLGLVDIDPETVRDLFAPMYSTFSECSGSQHSLKDRR